MNNQRIQFSHNSEGWQIELFELAKDSSKRFSVIHNGVDFTEFEVSSDDGKVQEVIDSFSIPDDAVIIGYYSEWLEKKA